MATYEAQLNRWHLTLSPDGELFAGGVPESTSTLQRITMPVQNGNFTINNLAVTGVNPADYPRVQNLNLPVNLVGNNCNDSFYFNPLLNNLAYQDSRF